MATFYFPTLTAEAVEFEMTEFIPAPENNRQGNECPAFWFGNAAVCFHHEKDGKHLVEFLRNYDVTKDISDHVLIAYCDSATYKAMAEYFENEYFQMIKSLGRL